MQPKYIPDDINVELLLPYFPEGSCKVSFKGLHKRNSYNDIVEMEEGRDGTLLLGVGRNSLYNSLPEFMFHPVDRFDNIPKSQEKERFAEEYQKQEQEKENAYRFFAPIDLLLLKLRVMVREQMNEYARQNRFLIDIVCDKLTEEQKLNRFVRHALNFVPSCKNIRGDKTLLTFMLRKIFMEEGLRIDMHRDALTYTDEKPRYADSFGDELDETYLGNTFKERTTTYDVHYWSEEECDEKFLDFVEEMNVFQQFIQEWFISVEETLLLNICQSSAQIILSDDKYNYLNYNTTL